MSFPMWHKDESHSHKKYGNVTQEKQIFLQLFRLIWCASLMHTR